jgi:hypothetical protein
MKALAAAGIAALALVGSAAGQAEPQVIRVLDVGDAFAFVDADRSGGEQPTAGDVFLFRDSLHAWSGGRRGPRLGRLEGYCTFTTRAGCEASGTAYLPAGRLQLAGHVYFPPGQEPRRIALSVVGGTGRYAGARGTAIGRPIHGTENTAFVFRLVR